MCVPQRVYNKGTGRGNPDNQGWVLFIREDGSYLPVQEALDKNYGSLMDQDSPVLDGTGLTVIIRFEVNKPAIFGDTLMLIGCSVAWIPIQRVPGEPAEIVLLGGG